MLGLDWRYGEVYALLLVLGGMTAMWFTMRRAKWLRTPLELRREEAGTDGCQ